MSASAPTRVRRWVAAPIVGLSLVALAACGSTDAASPTASATASAGAGDTAAAAPAGGPDSAQMTAFRECMTQHGVTMPQRPGRGQAPGGQAPADGQAPGGQAPAVGQAPPDGGQGGPPAGAQGQKRDMSTAPPGVDQATWTSARTACADLAPTPPSGTH
jgi:hypothetical protein